MPFLEAMAVGVVIGVDPHKGSHTAVVLDQTENALGKVRVIAGVDQLEQLRRWAQPWPERVWAIEGARGLGQLLTQQLLGADERVVDVEPKLAARVRLLNTGQVNKNDPKMPGPSPWLRCAAAMFARSTPRTRPL
jgi:transposase